MAVDKAADGAVTGQVQPVEEVAKQTGVGQGQAGGGLQIGQVGHLGTDGADATARIVWVAGAGFEWDLGEGVLGREAGPQFRGGGDDEAAHAGTSVAPSSGMRAETCCMAAS